MTTQSYPRRGPQSTEPHLDSSRLENVKRRGRKATARCPACAEEGSDKTGNHLVMYEDGRFGCVAHEKDSSHRKRIFELVGVTPEPPSNSASNGSNPPWKKTIERTHDYHSQSGEFLAQKVIYGRLANGSKDTSWRRPDPSAKHNWCWNLDGIERPLPLFNLHKLAQAEPSDLVWIVEGEKDCESLGQAGVLAVTNGGGAGEVWKPEYSEHLRGRDVILCPDNDSPGRAFMKIVAESLTGVVRSLRLVNWAAVWPNMPDKADITDALQDGMTVEDIRAVANLTNPAPAQQSLVPKTIDEKPAVELPGDDRPMSEFAQDMGGLLKDAGVYARGGCAFFVDRERKKLEPVDPSYLRTWVEEEVSPYRRVWTKDGGTFTRRRSMSLDAARCLCVAPQFLSCLPELRRFAPVRMPIMRDTGQIELLPFGFDSESLTLTDESGCVYNHDLSPKEGKAIIDRALSEFPFPDERSKAVAIAAMLTVYAGGLLPTGATFPAFIYLGNAEGCGKTTLASLAGAPYGTIEARPAPATEAEWQKRLLTLVMSGKRLVVLDNLRGHLGSASLEAYLTAARYGDRILGVSKEFEGEADAVVLMTGNHLTVTPDLRRRSLFVELFISELRAEDRRFERRLDPPAMLAMQSDLLAAMWALVRGWDAAKRPPASRESASFPRWSETVGGIVEAAGWACPTEPPEIEDGGDTDTRDITALATEMEIGREYTFPELVELCEDKDLFERFTVDREDDGLSRRAKSGFGKCLKGFDRRQVGPGKRLVLVGKGKSRRYELVSS